MAGGTSALAGATMAIAGKLLVINGAAGKVPSQSEPTTLERISSL